MAPPLRPSALSAGLGPCSTASEWTLYLYVHRASLQPRSASHPTSTHTRLKHPLLSIANLSNRRTRFLQHPPASPHSFFDQSKRSIPVSISSQACLRCRPSLCTRRAHQSTNTGAPPERTDPFFTCLSTRVSLHRCCHIPCKIAVNNQSKAGASGRHPGPSLLRRLIDSYLSIVASLSAIGRPWLRGGAKSFNSKWFLGALVLMPHTKR